MRSENTSAPFFSNPYVQIHLAVFLWGFTGVLGKVISLDSLHLVFLRMIMASGFYFLLPQTRAAIGLLNRHDLWRLSVIGVIICIHWLAFYQAIKEYNSASLGLICLGTGPMFILWIERILGRTKSLNMVHLTVSIIAILGLICISLGSKEGMPISIIDSHYIRAMGYGIFATILAAVFTILNGTMSQRVEPLAIVSIEMISGALLLTFFLLITQQLDFILRVSSADWFYQSILVLCCTCLPFTLSIYALKKLEPFVVTLSVNLEPIYGLLFAGLIWKEYDQFNIYFYLGSLLILFSVFLPIIHSRWHKIS